MERVSRSVDNGSIILFHNNAQHVLEYLPQVLENLQSSGYEIVKIDEMIYHENYHIDSSGMQISDGDGHETEEEDSGKAQKEEGSGER